MRLPLKKAALLLLLPVLAQALVIPDQVLDSQPDASAFFDSKQPPRYGGLPTFFEHVLVDNSIRFAIPCPDCSDEEQEQLNREIISVKATLQSTDNCGDEDPIGLEIDGQQVVPNFESDLALQSYVGPLHSAVQFSKHHIFNRTRWINQCGCPEGHGQECTGQLESSFSFEILGLASGQVPGFTISYRQYGAPELLRLSTFPDTGVADWRTFGESPHYRSPRLREFKAPTSSSISIPPLTSATSLSSPSLINSASFPSHTFTRPVPTIDDDLASTVPKTGFVTDHPNQASLTDIKISSDRAHTEDCDHKLLSRCRWAGALTDLSYRLGTAGTRVKSGAQNIFGKFRGTNTQQRLQLASNAARPLEQESFVDTVAHDQFDELDVSELHDNLDADTADRITTWQSQQKETFFTVDSPQTFWDFDKAVAIKAFQITSLIFIIVGLSASIYALVRRNPRLRAQWATMMEERRNRRLYRVAARKQRFQDFFDRFRLSSSLGEKASIIPTYNDAVVRGDCGRTASSEYLRQDMQNESGDEFGKGLQAFRKVHRFVDRILSAEEGRSSSSRRVQRDWFTNRTVRHQRAWSIGSEKTAPPAYESEGEEVIVDASGTRFMVIGRDVVKCNRTPGSSIISTSPRTSCADSDSEPDEKF